jgi:hypothetical protein
LARVVDEFLHDVSLPSRTGDALMAADDPCSSDIVIGDPHPQGETVGELFGFPPRPPTERSARTLLSRLIGNGFCATRQHAARESADFAPALHLAMRDLGDHVEIRARDNDTGIPVAVRKRVFESF